jgi:ABC-type polysaccharide/polyol phosphate transport system ATPase subunit
MARIALADVHLTFTLRNRNGSSIKDWCIGNARRLLRRPSLAPPPQTVHALRGVSLDVREGERLGIVGHNGAGKSTLLRVLAGIYRPTAGVCRVEGRIGSLFDLSLGFEPDATGWENIRYRGYLQKETPASIAEKAKQIAEFSELGAKLDLPIRYYSSGMLVRLAFSIATCIEPEVLLVDEVLAAGDLSFIHKARERIRGLMKRARLIVMVSHDLETLEHMCDRAVWLSNGRIEQEGLPHEVIGAYRACMSQPRAA